MRRGWWWFSGSRTETTRTAQSDRTTTPRNRVGIATGFFIAAVHMMGLVTLTHTPNPMGFLSELLERPRNEKAYLILPVGYPAPDAQVPDIERLPLSDIAMAVTRIAMDARTGTKLAF